jgi:hypothetical protein
LVQQFVDLKRSDKDFESNSGYAIPEALAFDKKTSSTDDY